MQGWAVLLVELLVVFDVELLVSLDVLFLLLHSVELASVVEATGIIVEVSIVNFYLVFESEFEFEFYLIAV